MKNNFFNEAYGREAGPPSERTLHPASQLGDCVDCGRSAEHRWHQPGNNMIGDGMVRHKYNPNSEPFEYL